MTFPFPILGPRQFSQYAVWNPADKASTIVLSNNNQTATASSAGVESVRATVGKSSGKWYWEISPTTIGAANLVGIGNSTALLSAFPGQNVNGHGWFSADGHRYNNGDQGAYATTWTTTDVLGFALDMTGLRLYFRKNATWQNSADPVAGTGGITIASDTWFPMAGDGTSAVITDVWTINAGQSAFANAAPSGYSALTS